MTRLFSALAVIVLLITIMACTRDNIVIEPANNYALVDQRLVPYFEAFVYEAAIRGVVVDFRDFPIEGYISDIQEDDIAGTCSYHSERPNVVTIDLEYWHRVSALRREMVVFHELGHCYLSKGHTESAFDNGACTSIMNSGTSGCFVSYTSMNRDYYLDELFADE